MTFNASFSISHQYPLKFIIFHTVFLFLQEACSQSSKRIIFIMKTTKSNVISCSTSMRCDAEYRSTIFASLKNVYTNSVMTHEIFGIPSALARGTLCSLSTSVLHTAFSRLVVRLGPPYEQSILLLCQPPLSRAELPHVQTLCRSPCGYLTLRQSRLR